MSAVEVTSKLAGRPEPADLLEADLTIVNMAQVS
jgi:hypothetical protein